MLNELWVEEGEARKLVLVQVHHEDFIGRCQIRLFRSELPVKVAYIFAMTLEWANCDIKNKGQKSMKGRKLNLSRKIGLSAQLFDFSVQWTSH